MLKNELFNCSNKDVYPPFKNGLYLEEYFYEKMAEYPHPLQRKYIPAKWTNFQLDYRFQSSKAEMQQLLDEWIEQNPQNPGYFTVVQQDDGVLLRIPENTIVYGACTGNIPLPLIYEDKNNTLENYPKKSFNEKQILCSFVGNITSNQVRPNVREVLINKYNNHPGFTMINSGGWTPNVNIDLQKIFIETTINSKFALAPRGYGRSSFRFFECFQLGTIPIYVWNDLNWLPFQKIIDYDKLCIVLHISEIDKLEDILLSIDEDAYSKMFEYYNKIKYLFNLEGMSNQIITGNANLIEFLTPLHIHTGS